jgi:hypothetical protein
LIDTAITLWNTDYMERELAAFFDRPVQNG